MLQHTSRGYKKVGEIRLPVYIDGNNNHYILSVDSHGDDILTPIVPKDGGYHIMHQHAIDLNRSIRSAPPRINGSNGTPIAPAMQGTSPSVAEFLNRGD